MPEVGLQFIFNGYIYKFIEQGLPGDGFYTPSLTEMKKEFSSKEEWDAFEWPEVTWPVPSPKPTWEEAQRYEKLSFIRSGLYYIQDPDRYTKTVVDSLTDASSQITTRNRFSHLAAVSHKLQTAAQAGGEWETSVVNDHTGDRIVLHDPATAQGLVDTAAAHRDRIESAASIYAEKMRRLARIAAGEETASSSPLNEEERMGERWKAYQEAVDLSKNAEAELADALDELESLEPLTLEEYRQVAHADLDVAATARHAQIVAVANSQGTILAPACIEQEDALKELAALRLSFVTKLDNADTSDEILKLVSRFQKQVEKIKVLNTPDWTLDGNPAGDRITLPWKTLGKSDDIDLFSGSRLKVGVSDAVRTKLGEDKALIGLRYKINGKTPKLGYVKPALRENFTLPAKPEADSSVPIWYWNKDGKRTDPAHGRHRLDIDAVNGCGAQRLTIDILHPKALIQDPNFQTFNSGFATLWTLTGKPELAVVTDKGLTVTDDDFGSERLLSIGNPIDINLNASYELSCIVQQPTGNMLNWLFVEFLDKNGVTISHRNFGSDPKNYPSGWLSIGHYFYWGVAKQMFPKIESKFSFSFGKGGQGRRPRGAKSFRVGAYLTYGPGDRTEVRLSQYHVNEIVQHGG